MKPSSIYKCFQKSFEITVWNILKNIITMEIYPGCLDDTADKPLLSCSTPSEEKAGERKPIVWNEVLQRREHSILISHQQYQLL